MNFFPQVRKGSNQSKESSRTENRGKAYLPRRAICPWRDSPHVVPDPLRQSTHSCTHKWGCVFVHMWELEGWGAFLSKKAHVSTIARDGNVSPGKPIETFVWCAAECVWGGCEYICVGDVRIIMWTIWGKKRSDIGNPNFPYGDVHEGVHSQAEEKATALWIEQHLQQGFQFCLFFKWFFVLIFGLAPVSSTFVLWIRWGWDGIVYGKVILDFKVYLFMVNSSGSFASSPVVSLQNQNGV